MKIDYRLCLVAVLIVTVYLLLSCNSNEKLILQSANSVVKAESENSGDILNKDVEGQYYESVGSLKLKIDNEEFLAVFQSTKVTLDKLPGELPYSIFTIKNLTTNKVVYSKNMDKFLLALYARDVDGDSRNELVLSTTEGASSSSIQIIKLKPNNIDVLFESAFRGDALLIDLTGKSVDIFISDSEDAGNPYLVKRFILKNGYYRLDKTVKYEDVIKKSKELFN